MPPTNQPEKHRSLQELVDALDLYPIEAFNFVRDGLECTVEQLHGCPAGQVPADDQSRHISGQQLCEGLRRHALKQWGMLARTVLRRWNITSTLDFGRIVFALVENGHLQKTDGDSIEDFRNVFEFRTAFEGEYRIEHAS